jgi:hypothetical protein
VRRRRVKGIKIGVGAGKFQIVQGQCARCGVAGNLKMVQGQECYMLWCCRRATVGAGTGMLDDVVLLESYSWCRDRNAR